MGRGEMRGERWRRDGEEEGGMRRGRRKEGLWEGRFHLLEFKNPLVKQLKSLAVRVSR